MEDMNESSGSNFTSQIAVVDRIDAPTTRALMFTRLGNFNQVENNLIDGNQIFNRSWKNSKPHITD